MPPQIDNISDPHSQAAAAVAPGGPHMNALKHGRYSESLLLPGEDLAEFRRQRVSMFHTYLPQTEDEAELVESLVEFRWLRQRFRPVQARFDAPAVAPEQDAAGRLCEPAGHKRLHSSTDVTLHRQRIERLWNRARDHLMNLQRLRRQGLIAGAVALPPGCYLDSSGVVLCLAPVTPARQDLPAAVAPAAPAPASGSGDGQIRISGKRKETGAASSPAAGRSAVEETESALPGRSAHAAGTAHGAIPWPGRDAGPGLIVNATPWPPPAVDTVAPHRLGYAAVSSL